MGSPSLKDLTSVFGRIGLLSFGGPAAQIALMHKELVEDRDWLSESDFLRALSFCMLLPGPEAMQLATFAGWKQRGVIGGLIGGGLFVLPGAIVMAALVLAYGRFGTLPLVQAMFIGVQATVVVIVIGALRKVADKALTGLPGWIIAAAVFIALFIFGLPFPLLIGLSAGLGAVWLRPDETASPPASQLRWGPSLRAIGIGGVLWAAPVLVLIGLDASFLTDLAMFFSTLAVVTFGGAYAVLAYMTQTVVQDFGWIDTTQMMDALGLAETTPGPLILVTQFVGMLAGLLEGGIGLALVAGAVTLWVTFVPCFIWIFAGAPLIDWLDGQPRLQGALSGITAAVVGVIANLSLWFAAHVFFARVVTVDDGVFNMILPRPETLNGPALILACVAAALLLWRGWGLLSVLGVTAALAGIAGLNGLV